MSQISHIKYKDIIEAGRFDADFFKPEYLDIDDLIYKKNKKTLAELSEKITDFWAYSQNNFIVYKNEWTHYFIRNQDITDFFINDENRIFIDEDVYKKLSLKLDIYDILLQRTWSIWKSAIVLERDIPSSANQNLAQVKLKKDIINPFYILTYLNCYFWKKYFERLATGNVQPRLNLQQIDKIFIPIFSENFQKQIEEIVKNSYKRQIESKYLYQEAEDLLLTELWLKNHTVSHTLTFSTTKKAVDEAWRYDADYFQPKYDELIEKIENYKWGWDYVENCIKVQDKNFIPEGWKLYKYIALANVSAQWFISDCEENYWENLPTRARRILHKWDVIVSSIEWSLSSCAVIEDEFDWWLCSNWFYVLNSDFFNSECLLVLFKSKIIQTLLKKWCSWTILTAISKDELNKIKLPLINSWLQKKISDKIKESFRLRNESKELLEQAKKMVEDEIEKE